MLTVAIGAYVIVSYASCAWFVHTQLDGLLQVAGWLLWPASPVLFPVIAVNALRGWSSR